MNGVYLVQKQKTLAECAPFKKPPTIQWKMQLGWESSQSWLDPDNETVFLQRTKGRQQRAPLEDPPWTVSALGDHC
jgi:hypothetical protein